MKLAAQYGLVPGGTMEERLEKLVAWGYEGVEMPGSEWVIQDTKVIRKAAEKVGIQVSTICAGIRGSILDPDPSVRRQALGDAKARLTAAGELGAIGLIFVPIFGPPRLPDLSPHKSASELERDLLLFYLDDLGKHAERVGVTLLLEPLNRYETHFLRRVEQAVELCEKIGNPSIGVMADFFHMNIEEASIPDAIRRGGKWIKHIHLADSNRLLPGWGHIDFRSGFIALKEIGYTNFMALECSVPGDPNETLPRAAQYLRECMV